MNQFSFTPGDILLSGLNLDNTKPSPGTNQNQFRGVEVFETAQTTRVDEFTLEHVSLDGGSFTFDFPIMITPSREPRINTTVVNENLDAGIAPGQVVESFGFAPRAFAISGTLVDTENHLFPLSKITEVSEALSIHDVYAVNNSYLNALGVFEVYVSARETFNASLEYPDSVRFQVGFSSHESVEALILNN